MILLNQMVLTFDNVKRLLLMGYYWSVDLYEAPGEGAVTVPEDCTETLRTWSHGTSFSPGDGESLYQAKGTCALHYARLF